MRAIQIIDTKFRRTAQQNMKKKNYIHEVPYKNCLKGLFFCITKTHISRYFSTIHHSDLYAQIIYVLHEKKTSATSSMLMSFSASWPPEPGIKLAPRRFSCPIASLWDLHLLHSGCDMSHSLRLSGKHLACGCNKSLVDSKEMSRRMMWESTSCMAWTQVHMLPRCSLGQRAQPALPPAFTKNNPLSPALKREF